ncbi:ABC transporter substrate-binding protein [Tessaracoccus lapidicaptus]|uniref:ABC transporter substrate-binding protein n=1 Tax=Tessaracoccus lapidicaptus TaxID=1427523 RepID=A0A1C0APL1_9ACTN|nr:MULTISPECIES: extracellular solute-binding protein [Tessaracoccus]AQX15321.1 ABC transporter substrate-binding protein [Tessaracoccus sp. T2.5-30]OCL36358.1 ABC transporter substrate-binding protein [Tessaracoccus lapidicaptus]VEP39597.1 Multiple sugar-binding protein [Tessaracoccus lapidicaptus]
MNFKKHGIAAIAIAAAAALSACSAGSLGSSDDDTTSGGAAAEKIELSFLVDNTETSQMTAQAIADGFMAENDDVEITIESRPGGADGDNIVKTKLATGEMNDIFMYNSGSLLQALDPTNQLVDLSSEEFMSRVDEAFLPSVSSGDKVFGVPFGQAMAGGILYNRSVYDDLGLEVPTTWDEFMANNEKIKAAGIDPVIQSFGDTWTSQLFILADFHNVTQAQSDWAEKYTANQAKYVDEPAIKGFQRLEEVATAGYMNEDYATAKLDQALTKLVNGEGAHYPMLTFVVNTYVTLADDAAENIGFFAQPGDDAATNGLTAWTPAGIYLPATTEGEELEAAKRFLDYVATPEACDAQTEAVTPTGPYMVQGCTLPDDLPQAVLDLQSYFDEGKASPALEFVSPVKGPNLEKITVEVGSGIRSAADGAKLYDQDVEKQAQQLGLEGW